MTVTTKLNKYQLGFALNDYKSYQAEFFQPTYSPAIALAAISVCGSGFFFGRPGFIFSGLEGALADVAELMK